MADVLRDLLVSIDFSDIDTKKLIGIDNSIDDIVKGLGGVDRELKDVGGGFDTVGRRGKQGFGEAEKGAKDLREEQEKVQKAVKNTQDGFGKLGTVAVGALGAITGATAGVVGVVGSMFAETDRAFSVLEARTGATGEELKALEGIVNDVFRAGFGDSVEQVSRDVSRLQGVFDDLSNTQLKNVTQGIYVIADAWEQDTTTITRSVKALTDNFAGLSEMDALNLIQVSFEKTQDYADDLLDTFNEYSGYFSDMGFSAREFANMLIKGADAGAFNLDKVGDAVKELGNLTQEYDGNASKAFKTIGLNADELSLKFARGGDEAQQAFVATIAGLASLEDPVKQQEAGVQLFGTQWEDLRGTVILAMSDSSDAVGYYGDAMSTATDALTDNIGFSLTNAVREFKGQAVDAFTDSSGPELLQELSDKAVELAPLIGDVTSKALGFANEIIDHWSLITGVLVPITAGLVAGYAAFKALTIISTITTLIGAFRAGTLLATAAQLGLNTAFLASPIGIITVGFGAIVTAGVLVYKNFDTIKEKAGQLFDFIKGFKVPDWLKTLGGGISTAFTGVKNLVMGSHATGLENVPFDGYTAELHKGESVLTANQSDALRDLGILRANGTKPVVDPSNVPTAMLPYNGGGGNTTFSPTVEINLTTVGGESDTSITERIKDAVTNELEALFRKLNLQVN